MEYNNKRLGVYLKTNFNNNEVSKNISYELDDIKDELKLNLILIDLKMQITDIWKEVNVVNLAIPLTVSIKFQHNDLVKLEKLKNTFSKIDIIDDYSLEEFNINNSFH